MLRSVSGSAAGATPPASSNLRLGVNAVQKWVALVNSTIAAETTSRGPVHAKRRGGHAPALAAAPSQNSATDATPRGVRRTETWIPHVTLSQRAQRQVGNPRHAAPFSVI